MFMYQLRMPAYFGLLSVAFLLPALGGCAPQQCGSDAECDDGLYCNGTETCNPISGFCQVGTPPCPDGRTCDEQTRTCENELPEVTALRRLVEDSEQTPSIQMRDGVPSFVSVAVPVQPEDGDDAVVHALHFLDRYKAFYAMKSPQSQLYLHRAKFNAEFNARTLRFRQRHNGIPVYGASLVVLIRDNKILMTAGHYLPEIPAMPAATISAATAKQVALTSALTSGAAFSAASFGGTVPGGTTPGGTTPSEPASSRRVFGEPSLTYFDRLLFQMKSTGTHLAWQVCVVGRYFEESSESSWLCFVDAHDGSLLACVDQSRDERDLNIYYDTGASTVFWDQWFDASCDAGEYYYPDPNGDPANDGPDACNYINLIYDFFLNNFNRRGWDGDDDNVDVFLYSNLPAGTCARYTSLAENILLPEGHVVPDLMTHEFMHGFAAHTTSFDGSGEPGAVEEHIGDVMGAMVEMYAYGANFQYRWNHGNLNGANICGPKNMSNPHEKGTPPAEGAYPDHYSERCTEDNDYCDYEDDDGGIHTNRMLLDKAASLLCDGGTHYGYHLAGAGWLNTASVYYWILMDEMPPEACSFVDLRNALVIASNMYAQNPVLTCKIKNAFAAVGVCPEGADTDCDGNDDQYDQDADGDGVPNATDNCPHLFWTGNADMDNDGIGNACDDDVDGDEYNNGVDNCPYIENELQWDQDQDGKGDVCDDHDGDGLLDLDDNCPDDLNASQEDTDGDGPGDACDTDDDNDGIPDVTDKCPLVASPNNEDQDDDGVGDICDNCPTTPNSDQTDCDGDGIGKACDDDAMEKILDENCDLPVGPKEWGSLFVHPGDLVTLTCPDCSNWLGPDDRIRVNFKNALNVAVHVVDGRGRMAGRLKAGAGQSLMFKPDASFHYVTPGTSEEPFHGTQYFLYVPEMPAGVSGVQLEFQIERVSATGG
ncbi:MAG: thrombospondin type 3 repeat-containing protein [Phycisphaerae bacterium]|nr:thrombospondin type 3 repeat-containing protein [Phycisphaerae bacterium]